MKSAPRGWARSAPRARRPRSPTPSITRPEDVCAICRSPSTSCSEPVMTELKGIVKRAAAMGASGEPGLLATLMSVRGSSYRRPGARLLIGCQGVAAGAVSGGCLERDLARGGWWETAGGGPALVTYDATDDQDDLDNQIGLG